MRQFMGITKALSDANRVRILLFLQESELCLCQIIEMLHLSAATVSKHMSILSMAGLVDIRKEGRWHYYRLPEEPTLEVKAAIEFLVKALTHSRPVKEDKAKIKRVLKMDKEDLCCHYKALPSPSSTRISER
jgi:ArsR family transcriptional regulator, arsenate/arsenite/antimonite-responsive transcriptional repressor